MRKSSFLTFLMLLIISTPVFGQAAGGQVIRKATKTTHAVVVDNAPRGKTSQAIDLGLPSGTKWAEWNIGASSPEQYGNYYAWGEVSPKADYSWATYFDSDSKGEHFKTYFIDNKNNNIGKYSVVMTNRDVAHVKWGGDWHIPTADQFGELEKQCKWERHKLRGVWGVKVTGPNGNSIFLPAAGFMHRRTVNEKGETCIYWSGDLLSSERRKLFEEKKFDVYDYASGLGICIPPNEDLLIYHAEIYRRRGHSIRAVKDR